MNGIADQLNNIREKQWRTRTNKWGKKWRTGKDDVSMVVLEELGNLLVWIQNGITLNGTEGVPLKDSSQE